MSDCGDHCITCSDEGIAMQVERVDVRRDSPCASARTARRAPSRSRLSSRLPGDRVPHAGVALTELSA